MRVGWIALVRRVAAPVQQPASSSSESSRRGRRRGQQRHRRKRGRRNQPPRLWEVDTVVCCPTLCHSRTDPHPPVLPWVLALALALAARAIIACSLA